MFEPRERRADAPDGVLTVGDRLGILEARLTRVEDKLGFRNAVGIYTGWGAAGALALYLLTHLALH